MKHFRVSSDQKTALSCENNAENIREGLKKATVTRVPELSFDGWKD